MYNIYMNLSEKQKTIQKEAIEFIQKNKNDLIQRFVLKHKPLKLDLLTIFMAGSPGAGKTEFSKRYLHNILNQAIKKELAQRKIDLNEAESIIVRLDVDEIRDYLPQFKKTDVKASIKGNSHVIQKAASKGLDILRSFCLKNGVSFIHDGTFGNLSTMRKLVKKSLKLGRLLQIYYIYIDPLAAWEFTKAREVLEGRNIVKKKFIEQFFYSRKNVQIIKDEFGNNVSLNCVLKSSENKVIDVKFNQPNLDEYLASQRNSFTVKDYTESDLLDLLT